jgi:hypothetical protein
MLAVHASRFLSLKEQGRTVHIAFRIEQSRPADAKNVSPGTKCFGRTTVYSQTYGETTKI